jgi:hypothetical protein
MVDEAHCSSMKLQAAARVDWRALVELQRLLGDIAAIFSATRRCHRR